MSKDYQKLWKNVTTDEAKAVRALAEILAEKEGRVFISRLDADAAELCVEILDHVSCDLHSSISSPQTVSSGPRRE